MEHVEPPAKPRRFMSGGTPQRIVLILGAIVILVMAVFPPWIQITPAVQVGQLHIPAKTTPMGYDFIGRPPFVREPLLRPTRGPTVGEMYRYGWTARGAEWEWADLHFQPKQDEVDDVREKAPDFGSLEMLNAERSPIPRMIRMVEIDLPRVYFQITAAVVVITLTDDRSTPDELPAFTTDSTNLVQRCYAACLSNHDSSMRTAGIVSPYNLHTSKIFLTRFASGLPVTSENSLLCSTGSDADKSLAHKFRPYLHISSEAVD